MISAINHVQITVPRDAEARARAFYCGLLGLPELEKPESLKANGGFWLAVGTMQVHIGLEDFNYRHQTKAHIAFEIENAESLRTLLKDNNIEIIEPLQFKGLSVLIYETRLKTGSSSCKEYSK